MEFLTAALNALPQAATQPFAFLAYLLVIFSWVILSIRVKRNAQLLKYIEKLPEKDRLTALQGEMGSATVKEGISPTDWLASKRQNYYFLGFIALLVAVIIVFAMAVAQSRAEQSRNELVSILSDRGNEVISRFDILIKELPDKESAIFDTDGDKYSQDIKLSLVETRNEAKQLIDKMTDSLKRGDFVRAHDLGNQINDLSNRINLLRSKSLARTEQLKKLSVVLSTMNPKEMDIAIKAHENETKRSNSLEYIIFGLNQMINIR